MSLRQIAKQGLKDPTVVLATAGLCLVAVFVGFAYPRVGLALALVWAFTWFLMVNYRKQRRGNRRR